MHTHFIPQGFVDLLRSGEGPEEVQVLDRKGKDPLVVHDNGLRYPVFPMFADPLAKLAQMDADGIDASLVSIVPSLFLYWMSPAETARTHKLINDAGAQMCAASGGRLQLLATVPMNDPQAAAQELYRAHSELGAVGVEIGTSVGEMMLDDPALDPFFAAAAELSTPVMLHPYMSMITEPGSDLRGFHLGNAVGNPFETAVAAARLIVGGVFDRHPRLTVQLSHGGGAIPYTLGRLAHAYEVREETKAIARNAPFAYLQNFLFDTILYDERALSFLIEIAGEERVLFGSDIPFDMADASLLKTRSRTDAQSAAILGENAARAYRLRTGATAA